MPYDPERHHRRSIRLKGYDYSQAGAYFVTILVKNRACVLGEVVEGEMHLSEVGLAVQEVLEALPGRYPGVVIDASVIMPNHVHFIVIITEEAERAARQGAAQSGDARRDEVRASATSHMKSGGAAPHESQEEDRLRRRRMLLPKIIGYFKMNAAKRANIILDSSGQPFWQRNYYEHIIRNTAELDRIRAYIRNNPAKWIEDQLQPGYPSRW